VGVVSGKRSGVEAFLRGRLRVRGNLSLALKLDGLFDRSNGAGGRPRPGRISAGGLDTFYVDAGQGFPVILLHGLGATNASMLTTMWELARDYRVIAPDLPGFGDSAKPSARYDSEFFARWLTAFLDALGIERAHLVGNSMGGRVAIETALRAPERVARLGLLAPSMAFRRFRQAVPLVRVLSPQLAAMPMLVPRMHVLRTIRMLFARPERIHRCWYEAAVDEFQRVFSTARGRVAFFSAAREIYLEQPFGDAGFWNRVRGLTRPALFLWGRHDRMVPAKFARHVVDALPSAYSHVLEDCGHIPQFERPAVTHGLIREFLAKEREHRAISQTFLSLPALEQDITAAADHAALPDVAS
jgi:pimeloyl-ACP methyl ester carboxylesterase